MNNIANLLISIIIGIWIIAIALISVQNATPVALKFLGFQSIEIPFGLLLAFFAAVGWIGVAVLQPLWELGENQRRKSQVDEDAEFFIDDEDF